MVFAVGVLSASGCFNPDPVAMDGDTDSGQTSSGTDGTTSPSSETNPTTPTSDTATDTTDTTGPQPECREDSDCAAMASECEVGRCDAQGVCVVENADEGTACGDATDTECDAADTCDGNGTCSDNRASNGSDCSDCPTGQCTCNAGSCGECVVFADTNLFSTPRSLVGWELTGDWGLYTEAPVSQSNVDGLQYPAIPFNNQVLGTDGNRHGPAYPGGHMERSYARTPPTELPTSLQFQSWHLDEGAGSYDNKIIRISTDGGDTWTDIISCVLDPGLPFCQPRNVRDGDDWDTISLDLPAPLIGQVGIIEFSYDTFDSCCNFEKGWYIDVTNFATECACTADEVCEPYGSECGAAVCGGNGGCNVDPVSAGTACGTADDNTCTAPDACDGFGYCQPNDVYPAFTPDPLGSVALCDFCEAGDDCVGCAAGECQDCADLPDVESFDPMNFPPYISSTFGWDFTSTSGGNWGVFYNISNNEQNDGTLSPTNAPFLGIDGVFVSPADGTGEVNQAAATTRPDVFANTLEFISWHQDQGGPSLDRKRIEITVNDGATWIPVADCSIAGVLSSFPFCTAVTTRGAEDWDTISIDISDYAGMTGRVRFLYNTVSACCAFERGWYIDDLNFAQVCDAPNTSSIGVPCLAWTDQDNCNNDQTCAWDGGAGECIACTALPQEQCDMEPLCEWHTAGTGATCIQAG